MCAGPVMKEVHQIFPDVNYQMSYYQNAYSLTRPLDLALFIVGSLRHYKRHRQANLIETIISQYHLFLQLERLF